MNELKTLVIQKLNKNNEIVEKSRISVNSFEIQTQIQLNFTKINCSKFSGIIFKLENITLMIHNVEPYFVVSLFQNNESVEIEKCLCCDVLKLLSEYSFRLSL